MIEISVKKSETHEEVKEYIANLSTDRLLILCNEIYDWETGIGELVDGELKALTKEINMTNPREVEDLYVMPEIANRFQKTIPLLLTSPYAALFFRHFS